MSRCDDLIRNKHLMSYMNIYNSFVLFSNIRASCIDKTSMENKSVLCYLPFPMSPQSAIQYNATNLSAMEWHKTTWSSTMGVYGGWIYDQVHAMEYVPILQFMPHCGSPLFDKDPVSVAQTDLGVKSVGTGASYGHGSWHPLIILGMKYASLSSFAVIVGTHKCCCTAAAFALWHLQDGTMLYPLCLINYFSRVTCFAKSCHLAKYLQNEFSQRPCANNNGLCLSCSHSCHISIIILQNWCQVFMWDRTMKLLTHSIFTDPQCPEHAAKFF